jgi:hypothetical protein
VAFLDRALLLLGQPSKYLTQFAPNLTKDRLLVLAPKSSRHETTGFV